MAHFVKGDGHPPDNTKAIMGQRCQCGGGAGAMLR
jgi:hypothetical protein